MIITTSESSQRLTIYWRQNQQNFEILLNGTLGTSVARLVSDGDAHYIDVPGKSRQFAASPAALLFETTGLKLPVETLIPVLNGSRSTASFEGWKISTVASDDQGRPLQLSASGQDVLIRLTVTEWL